MVNQNLAEQIQTAVERALTTQNFSGLTQNISDAVNTSIAQIETNNSRSNEPHLEHVNGEIVTDESIADYQARKRAAEEEANRARYNSRRAEEARMQEEARRRREEEMRQRTRTYQNNNQGAGNPGQPGNPGSNISRFVTNIINEAFPNNPFQNNSGNVNGPRSQYYARGGKPYSEQRTQQTVTQQRTDIVPISRTPAGCISGPLLTVFGGLGMFGSYTMLALSAIFTSVDLWSFAALWPIAAFAMIPVAAISTVMVLAGAKKLKRVKRFRQYVRQLRGRAYCTIKELSSHIGKSERFVLKDMRKMISLGMFPEGHIDDQETCVMLNGPTYDQYRKAQNSYLARQKEEQLTGSVPGSLTDFSGNSSANNSGTAANTQSDAIDRSKLPPKVQETLKLGEQYLVSIREANAAIPGEIITAKLDKLEQIIAKIYARIERHPEQVGELDKFISYYLPTTQKLVNAYREFDSQPVQGETIQNSKKEIESTLDMILYAFEQLLDSLYEDDAMDISTDISVLQTMFAQEGLTKKDFHTTP